MGNKLRASLTLGLGLIVISLLIYHERKPFSLAKVELKLGAANLANDTIQRNLDGVIHYFES
ncbi:MAG: hypothetical protein ACE5G1_16765, partial [bacterium]